MSYSPWGCKESDMTSDTHILCVGVSPGGSVVKTRLPVQETKEMQIRSLGQEDALEEEMATHSSIFTHGWGESPRFLPLLLRLPRLSD